ncbi:cilia- and flagella-associated protein 91 [Xiphophorus maculatus]|uniref:Cilia- and flagella-associated protein 91 n=1 Tax=Xiphophorus maculatus TaxID=8083 RepID=M3ZP50_XIPMA|nr:cilia- and flagella-associated protein 91 [Xiphophorus maculatus]XP_027877858.1 cilia- and flagella-associated protein 91 [Xiphophorus couchianus]
MSCSITQISNENKDYFKAALPRRPSDCVRDSVYTAPSEPHHHRPRVRAYTTKERFRKLHESDYLLSGEPLLTFKTDPAEPMPSRSDYRWQAHAERRRETLRQLAGIHPNPQTCLVTGADYWKYYKRPWIPFEEKFPADVVFEFAEEDFITTTKEQLPAKRSLGIQTDFRESETQTDPYSPEYVVQRGMTPTELLQLATLTWGHGLPAGLAEVEMIERAREKRIWETTLPPRHDLTQIDKRRRMMEEMEAKEWAFRESEIEKVQEIRLAVLGELLRQRDEAQKDTAYDRLTQLYAKHLKDRELKLEKTHHRYIRSIRKLETKRKNVEGKLQRRDIVADFQTHNDKFPYGNMKMFNSDYINTYEGLQELETGLAASLKQVKTQWRDIKGKRKSAAQIAVELLEDYRAVRDEEGKEIEVKGHRFPFRKEKPLPTPPVTPLVEIPSEEDEKTELAIIFLQKLLRGRSIQFEIFKGKENQLELIRELRKVHALQAREQNMQKAEKDFILMLKRERDQQMEKAAIKEARQAAVIGVDLAQVFFILSQELIHLQEERRVHAFMLLAERERRRREAEESGRRQVEERRRQERDEIFREIVQVHQESVDMYLEDMILRNVDYLAEQQAREEIHKKAQQLNDIAYAMEENKDKYQPEEIVSELVYSFLIPEIEKMRVRRRVQLKQLRHLEAARRIIHGFEVPMEIHPPETPQESTADVRTSGPDEEVKTSQESQE